MASLPERFLPVEPLIRQIVKEQYPELNTNPGTAIYDTFILPASLLYQRFRDTARVMYRNQSLEYANTMLPEELDRLATNFLVERRSGTNATGTQRLYFNSPQAVNVDTSARFFTNDGIEFRPVTAVSATEVEVAANIVGDEYYVDVPIISSDVGSATRATAGTITTVRGVLGASRTENLETLSGGDSEESNSELYARLRSSLSNRELVKKDGIASAIQDAFPSVRSVLVQGYGDEGQTSDRISASVRLDTVVPTSFCGKVNLPLNSEGEVDWDQGGSIPQGGFVGAIYDLTGRDLTDIAVTLDGRTTIRVAAAPNQTVRFLNSTDEDFQENDFRVTRVQSVSIEPDGDPVKVLRLNKPLSSTTQVDDDPDQYPYRLLGKVFTDDFHVGGKIDVYLDSEAEQTNTVVVSSVPAAAALSGSTEAIDVGEIPLVASATDSLGNGLFEEGVGFISPVISVTKVEQLDFVNDNEVVRELIPGVHYVIVRASERSKYTQIEDDLLVVRGSENPIDPITGQPSDVSVPLFVGQRLRVTYVTNPEISAVQSFVDSSSQRDVTKEISVFYPSFIQTDVQLTYTGDVDVEVVQDLVRAYIENLGFGSILRVSDLIPRLTSFGVQTIQFPVTLKASRYLPNGRVEFIENTDNITLETAELFRPVESLSITKA